MQRFNPKGFAAGFLGLIALTAIGTAAVNIVVDPYWRFDLVSIEGFNAQHYAANSRLGKAGALCRIKPTQVLLGTSRVEVGIDPTHPGFADLPGPIYNAALAGSGLHELDLTIRHAVYASPNLKRLLIGLDFLMFNAHREAVVNGTEVVDFDEGRLLKSPHDSCMGRFFYDFDQLLGVPGLRISLGSVKKQMPEPSYRQVAGLGNWISLPDKSGFRRNFAILERTRIARSGYRSMFGIAQERYYTSKIWRAGPQQRYCFTLKGRPSTIDVFRGIVRFARASGVDVRFFINPIHARMLMAIREAGLWPQYEDWKRTLVAVLAEEAKESGRPQLPLWDFSGFNTVTTEVVPPRGDTTTILHGFWEPSHFKYETGDLMLDRMLGYRDPHRRLPPDFGVALTPNTIKGWIAATRAGAEAYARAQPGEIEIVNHTVDAVMADAEGANCGEDVEAARAGAAALARGDRALAEADFRRAATLHEANRKRYAALGVPYREQGFEKVLADARHGVGGEPMLSSWIAYQSRGIERQKKGDYRGAASDFSMAIRIGPTNTALHFLKGTALLQGGEPAGAEVEFEKGLKLDPANKTLRQLLMQARNEKLLTQAQSAAR